MTESPGSSDWDDAKVRGYIPVLAGHVIELVVTAFDDARYICTTCGFYRPLVDDRSLFDAMNAAEAAHREFFEAKNRPDG